MTSASNDTGSPNSDAMLDMPCETRYRTSRYFQEDRLRCSEAAADLRMMKDLMESLSSVGMPTQGRVLAFQPISIAPQR